MMVIMVKKIDPDYQSFECKMSHVSNFLPLDTLGPARVLCFVTFNVILDPCQINNRLLHVKLYLRSSSGSVLIPNVY